MSADWLERFRARGALHEGHFLLSSGLHSPAYVQSALILQYPDEAEALGRELAHHARTWRPAVVVGPALGAIVIAHEVARALEVRAVFAERTDGLLALRRGFRLDTNERALVVEDVVTTGGTTREVAALVEGARARVAGAVALIDRTGGRVAFPWRFHALVSMDLPVHPADSCPLCQAGVPITKPGSRIQLAPETRTIP